MNEMEASLAQTKIEQAAKVEIAKIDADAKIKVAKRSKPRLDIYWNGVIGGVLAILGVFGVVGAVVYHSVNDSNNKAAQIARCEEAGGTWTPRIQRIYDPSRSNSGDEHDEWYEVCVKK